MTFGSSVGRGEAVCSTMELSGRINEELLICQICYVRYSQVDRLPKLLACSHTFCADCILQYLRKRKKSKHKFPCPLCRKETQLGKDGVSGLGNNLTIMGLMDILDRSTDVAHQQEDDDIACRDVVVPMSPGKSWRPGLSSSLSGWTPPPSNTRSLSGTVQCDNCQNMGNNSLLCGHIFCGACSKECVEGGECIQCSVVTATQSQRNRTERPPPVNPAYQNVNRSERGGSVPSAPPPRAIKPVVPVRSSPVKPLTALSPIENSPISRMQISAPVLQTVGGATAPEDTRGNSHRTVPVPAPRRNTPASTLPQTVMTRHGSAASSTGTLTRIEERDASLSPDPARHRGSSSYNMSPRPHTMHIATSSSSSTLPRSSTFGMALRSQMMLPCARDGNSTQSLPEIISEAGSSQRRVLSPPQPPPRRFTPDGTSMASPLRCLAKFGRFSTVRLQTNAFHQPTNIAVSEFTNDWAVVDAVNMSLQIFDQEGGYISMFKVLGIKSACFISPDRLAICTHRGVEIYRPDGTSLHDLSIGRTDAIAAYKHGFIAVKPKSLHFFSQSFAEYKQITRRSSGKLKRSTAFQQIVSIAVSPNSKDIVILDTKLGDITVMDESGKTLLVVDPKREACGKLLAPEAVAVDRNGNIIVSDSGNRRLLRFSANGMYSRCLLNLSLGGNTGGGAGDVTVHGVAVREGGAMAVVLAGAQMAEVRVYHLM